MKKILLEDALILSAAKVARWIVHRLPLKQSLFLARVIGRVIYAFNKRKRVAYQNLRAAFAGEKSPSELKAISKKSFENLVMAIAEFLRVPDMDRAYLDKHVRFMGLEKFRSRLQEKKGLIFLAAHFGNWELLSVAGSILGFPMVALARVQKHPRSDAFLNSLRTCKGASVIHKGMPLREILRSLKDGKIVGILSDQDGGRSGTFVKFFSRWSSTPGGVSTFAMRTGSPIFPVFMFREGITEHRVEVEGPLQMPAENLSHEKCEKMVLQQFADLLEKKIRKSPEQWLWAHRRWKSTPDRSVILLSDKKQGHLNQSLAVLEAIRKERATKGCGPEHTRSQILEVQYQNPRREKLFRALAILFSGHIPFKSKILRWVLSDPTYAAVTRTYADIVISCGSSLSALNLLVKDLNVAKSVVIMKPPFSTKRFDLVIAPGHDRLKPSGNVFVTRTSPSLVSEGYLKERAEYFAKSLEELNGSKRIGLLVGGDTERLKFSKEYLEKFLERLGRFGAESGALILATSSRRTPAWAAQLMKELFKDRKRCPLLVIANESNADGVVGGILGLSDAVVVSGESISMVSEAVSSGKPVLVFMPSDRTRVKPKHEDFLRRLEKERLIVRAGPDNISGALENSLSRPERATPVFSGDLDVLSEAVKKVAG